MSIEEPQINPSHDPPANAAVLKNKLAFFKIKSLEI
jgi:hypothetical protein